MKLSRHDQKFIIELIDRYKEGIDSSFTHHKIYNIIIDMLKCYLKILVLDNELGIKE